MLGMVAIATSQRHWSEQLMVLTQQDVRLYVCKDDKKPSLIIPSSSIISVKEMEPSQIPFEGYYFFEVATLPRVYYFCVFSDSLLRSWLGAFNLILSDTNRSYSLDEMFLAKPIGWKMKNRRVLNYRRIIFKRQSDTSPVQVVEKALSLAFDLIGDNEMVLMQPTWIQFLDTVSLLQMVDVRSLGEKERIACLLNIYHVMMLHGYLVIGPPLAWYSWPSYFNTVSYLIGFDSITLAELDHNIIRANMSPPSPVVVQKFAVPKSSFPGLSLTHPDFRINFALICGCKSQVTQVPIFKASFLDEQLDEVTLAAVRENVEIDEIHGIVYLPIICNWYLQDFGRVNTTTTPFECLITLWHYIKGHPKEKLARMMSLTDSNNFIAPDFSIKYHQFSYRCGFFTEMKNTNWSIS